MSQAQYLGTFGLRHTQLFSPGITCTYLTVQYAIPKLECSLIRSLIWDRVLLSPSNTCPQCRVFLLQVFQVPWQQIHVVQLLV